MMTMKWATYQSGHKNFYSNLMTSGRPTSGCLWNSLLPIVISAPTLWNNYTLKRFIQGASETHCKHLKISHKATTSLQSCHHVFLLTLAMNPVYAISVSFCLRAPGYGLTLWCVLGLLVGGARQVPQLQLQWLVQCEVSQRYWRDLTSNTNLDNTGTLQENFGGKVLKHHVCQELTHTDHHRHVTATHRAVTP